MGLDFTLIAKSGRVVFDANITHNLTEMADDAGLYCVLWRPEENGFKTASDCIDVIADGLHHLRMEPEKFKDHDNKDGWGTYDDFVPWVERVLHACEDNETAIVRSSR